jgi:hypothetical protein
MNKKANFTVAADKQDAAKKVFASFENETLRELGDKIVGGVWIEVSWGQGTKPKKEVEQQEN